MSMLVYADLHFIPYYLCHVIVRYSISGKYTYQLVKIYAKTHSFYSYT